MQLFCSASASRCCLKVLEFETHRESPYKLILFALHIFARYRRFVVEARQMQNPVNSITDQFILPGHPKLKPLRESFVQANEDFSGQEFGAAGVCVIERDDIC